MTSTIGQPNDCLRVGRRPGFTLIELILVMAIVTIVVAIAVPSLHGFAIGRRAGNCAEEIVALAHWARTQAIARGLVYRLNLDQGTNRFWLTVERDDGTVGPPGEEFGRVFTAPVGARLSWDAPPQQDGSGSFIRFQPTGRIDTANITVTDPTGRVTQITCYSQTENYHIVTAAELQAR